MSLPDPQQLIATLAEQLKKRLGPDHAMVGIHTGGVWVAERLHTLTGLATPLGNLDIAFYRDDFSRIGLHPEVKPSHIPFDVEGRHIVLVDDVLHTGRTVRAAMNALFDYGRPESISLVVLVDRGGREMPVCADHVGAHLSLAGNQNVQLLRDDAGTLQLEIKPMP